MEALQSNVRKLVKKLKGVLRRATQVVKMIQSESYSDRLRASDLPPLEYARRRGGMTLTFKLLTSSKDTDPSLLFGLKQNNTTGHKRKQLMNRCN